MPRSAKKSPWNMLITLASAAVMDEAAPGLPALWSSKLNLCVGLHKILCGTPDSLLSWNCCKNSLYKTLPSLLLVMLHRDKKFSSWPLSSLRPNFIRILRNSSLSICRWEKKKRNTKVNYNSIAMKIHDRQEKWIW